MPRRVVPSASLCEEIMDSCAEIMWSNMPDNVQIEGNTSEDDSTLAIERSLSFEKAKDGCCAVTIAVPMPLEETMNDGTYSYVAPQDIEDIVHQYPSENESHIAKLSESENKSELSDSTKCENKSHIAKLSESENKSELCDSTKCEIESINNMSVRDTPHKKKELHCKTCEDVFSNPLISTSSVVSHDA